MAAGDPLIGHLLEGRYRVRSWLAVGGMSTVYAGVDERLDREVAIKVMAATLSADPVFLDRFAREARTAARLSHVNAVAVYDQGRDGNQVFLVMELVRGRTLRDLLRERGHLSPAEAVSLLEPVLAALAAAHRAGLVHRDVKPENILLADDGLVKVADFGLARAVAAEGEAMHTGLIMGTVAYSSPEQFRRGNADTRSDVYSAGIMLFELLTGRQPHVGPDAMSVAYNHVHADVAPPSAFQPGIGPALDALVRRATARDPQYRPQDAGAFLAQLHDVRRELRLPMLPVPRRARPTVDPRVRVVAPQPPQRFSSVQPTQRQDGGGPVRGAAPRSDFAAGDATTVQPRANRPHTDRYRPVTGVNHTLVAPVAGPAPAQQPAAQQPLTHQPVTHQPLTHQPLAHLHSPTTQFAAPASPLPAYGPAPPSTPVAPVRPRRRRRFLRTLAGSIALLLVAAALVAGSWWYAAGRWNSIPNVSNRPTQQATQLLQAQGFHVVTDPARADDDVPRGAVIGTDPDTGARLVKGRTVHLLVSSGPAYYAVPDVHGRKKTDADDALSKLSGKGVTIAYTQTADDKIATGRVVRTDPDEGTKVRRGQTVTVYLSSGPPSVELPDEAGQDATTATAALTKLKFTVTETDEYSDKIDAGTVISQDPPGPAQLIEGSTVALTVSKGPDLVTVPTLPQLDPVVDAEARITAAGLTWQIRSSVYGSTVGRVLMTDPAGGTQVKRGSTVTLTVI